MADGNVIELPARKTCRTCGVQIGTRHKPECVRSPENMRALIERREALYASGERQRPTSKRLRLGRREVDEVTMSAAEMLYGDRAAAVAVLRKQMKSKDEKIAQNAASKILAYTDGTPTQKIEQVTDNVTEVVYRSAALAYEEFQPGLEDAAG